MTTLATQLLLDDTDASLIEIINALSVAGQQIAEWVSQGALAGLLGPAASDNVQGERQQQLDILANNGIQQLLLALPQVAAMASEEDAEVIPGNASGNYLVAFDPLDGSSNIVVNGASGTIFSVYRACQDIAFDASRQFLQLGREQLCAGYVLYGPATMLALTTGGPTRLYCFDQHTQAFVLTQSQLQIAPQAHEFAVNMAYAEAWAPAMQQYIRELQLGADGPRGRAYNMRWCGAMVADIHRVLVRGGIFLYPSQRGRQEPNKLRLLYEANPMAMLVTKAGGRASAGREAILDIQPRALHQRVPVFMGAADEVAYVQALLASCAPE